MKWTALLATIALAGGSYSATVSGQIIGKVTLDGEAPEPKEINMAAADPKCAAIHANPIFEESIVVGDKNELANVVVSIKAPEGKPLKGTAPKEPVIVDQKGCQYVPHVVALMVGQEVVVKNSDPVAHNVHSITIDNVEFNFQQGQKGAENKVGNKIKTAERFGIKCDIHPWMYVHVNAFEHPFFAVSNEKGEFSIPTKGLPDGAYNLEIWHEKLAPEPITQEIEIKGGKAKVEEIKMPATGPAARADDVKATAKLTSAVKTVGPECCAVQSKAQVIAAASAKAKQKEPVR
jgi:plastocyanin